MDINKELVKLPVVTHTKESGVQIITIKGNLTYGSTQHAKDQIKDFFDKTADGFLLDMSHVDTIDSTGFGVLINFAKKIAEIDRKMAIIVTNEFIDDLFKLSKLYLVFPIVKTKAEGFEVLKGEVQLPLQLRDY